MLETYKSNLQKEYNFELDLLLYIIRWEIFLFAQGKIYIILAPGILMIFLDEANFPRNLQRLT